MSVIGVPVKVLHEAEGHIVTVETTTGEVSIDNVQYVHRYIIVGWWKLLFFKIFIEHFPRSIPSLFITWKVQYMNIPWIVHSFHHSTHRHLRLNSMYITFVSSKNIFSCCFVLTNVTWIANTSMSCFVVFNHISFWSENFITLGTYVVVFWF